MTSDIKWSCLAHSGIALLIGIATIARAKMADLPSTTFSAALAGSAIFLVTAILVNRAEGKSPDRSWLLFSFYMRSITAVAVAGIVTNAISADRSWFLLLGMIIPWCCLSLARSGSKNAAQTFAFTPAQSRSVDIFTNTVAIIQFAIFLPTLLFL